LERISKKEKSEGRISPFTGSHSLSLSEHKICDCEQSGNCEDCLEARNAYFLVGSTAAWASPCFGGVTPVMAISMDEYASVWTLIALIITVDV